MKVDHIAIVVEDPQAAAKWYSDMLGAECVYADETWSLVQFENIKMAFVVANQHPRHVAFNINKLPPTAKEHRDGSKSIYRKDPWGNIYELVVYPEDHTEALE